MSIQSLLLIVSWLSAAAYGLHFTHQPISIYRTFMKASAVGSLALVSWFTDAPTALTCALALGTLGDVFLSRDGERNFLFGLIAFLVGHLCYVLLLVQMGGGPARLIDQPSRLIPCIALIIITFVILRTLTPHLGQMRLPVWAYAFVIVLMGLLALSLPLSWPTTIAILGALMFIASDAILGFELFVIKDPVTADRTPATVLWFLYWGGQFLIFLSVVPI